MANQPVEKPLKIIVAEDQPCNQKFPVTLLTNQGYDVTVVADGSQVLAALERESFHLILMDIHMPNMDGFQATAAIRKKERMTGTHIPIIGITADVIKGNKDACLKAGMDGHIFKPYEKKDLIAVIESVLFGTKSPEISPKEEQSTSKSFDSKGFLNRCLGDSDIANELVGMFFAQGPELLSKIKKAIEARNAKDLEMAAHNLKSVVGSFEAKRAFDAAFQLEIMGEEKIFTSADETYRKLEEEVSTLINELKAFRIDKAA